MKNIFATIRFALVAICACAGCSKSGALTVPVHGTVTFEGAAPPAAGTINFIPISAEEGLPRRPGSAQFGTDGTFRASSFHPNDGLVPGVYGTSITCWKSNPATSSEPDAFEKLNYVPKDFKPPTVTVDSKTGDVEVAINIPKKN
jgi:hypothetical protein